MIFTAKDLPAEYLTVTNLIAGLREKLRFATSDSLHRWTRLLARTAAARAMVGTNVMEGVNVTFDDAVAAIDGEPPMSEEEQDRQERVSAEDVAEGELVVALLGRVQSGAELR